MYKQYIQGYLNATHQIAKKLSESQLEVINKLIQKIQETKEKKGRVFFIGVGGGSGTGSHATNDFNKIAEVAALCLTDNASLLTALANDEGWSSIFIRQMKIHNFEQNDCLFIYSVGGGAANVSSNIVEAINYAKQLGSPVVGVVGKDTGHAAQHGDAVVVIPTMHADRITPHTEDWQLVIDHLIVNALANEGKWE